MVVRVGAEGVVQRAHVVAADGGETLLARAGGDRQEHAQAHHDERGDTDEVGGPQVREPADAQPHGAFPRRFPSVDAGQRRIHERVVGIGGRIVVEDLHLPDQRHRPRTVLGRKELEPGGIEAVLGQEVEHAHVCIAEPVAGDVPRRMFVGRVHALDSLPALDPAPAPARRGAREVVAFHASAKGATAACRRLFTVPSGTPSTSEICW